MARKGKYFLLGGLIGAIIALLFTPKSGKEVREDILEKTRDMVNNPDEFKETIKYKMKNILNTIQLEDNIIDSEQEIIISKEFNEEEND